MAKKRTTKKSEPKRIHQFITKGAGNRKRKIGVLVGEMRDKTIFIGWSRANESMGDKFDRDYGMNLAIERLKAKEMVSIPDSIVVEVVAFQGRCQRYFKDADGTCKITVQPLPANSKKVDL